MKKLIPIILSLALIFCLAACGKDVAESPDPEQSDDPSPIL